MKRYWLPALIFAAAASLAYGAVIAEETVTTEGIIQSLKPKPRTRGLSAPGLQSEDASFIQQMKHKTRGLTIEERSELTHIVTKAGLPEVGLEVNFALDSARLEPAAVSILRKLGAALSSPSLDGSSFLVAGHTDASGTPDYNQKLSEERAFAVRSFLATNFPIPADRLLAVGYGQEQLKNKSDPFADENRRVEIVNLGKN